MTNAAKSEIALRNATREHRVFECTKRLRPQLLAGKIFGLMARSFEGRFLLTKKKPRQKKKLLFFSIEEKKKLTKWEVF